MGICPFVQGEDRCFLEPLRDLSRVKGHLDEVGHGGRDNRGQLLEHRDWNAIYTQSLGIVQAQYYPVDLPFRWCPELEPFLLLLL